MLHENENEICPVYISKYDSTYKRQIIPLLTPNGKGWHYLAVTKLSGLLRETQMKGSDLIFDCINLMYYKCHKIGFKCGGSYIDFPD